MIDGVNQPGLLRRRYKEMRGEHCAIIIKHAQQYFIVIDGFIRNMHNGLEVEQELIMQKRMLDLFLPIHESMHALPRLLLIGKQVPATSPCFLRLVHRQISRCQQIVYVISMLGKERDTDTCQRLMGTAVYGYLSLAQACEGIFCNFYRTFRSGLRQYYCEFIPPQAPEYIHVANTAEQHARNHLQ